MLSRRQVLRSLAASSAARTRALAGAVRSPRPSRIGSAANRAQIVDFDFDVTPYLAQLKSAGVKTIGRYYDRAYGTGIGEVCYHHKSKTLTKAELTAIERAGMSVYVIFQHCGAQCANFDLAKPGRPPTRGARTPSAAVRWRANSDSPRTRRSISRSISIRTHGKATARCRPTRIWPSIEQYFDQINEVLRANALAGRQSTAPARHASASRRAARRSIFWLSTSLGHIGSPEFFNGGALASVSERHRDQAHLRARHVRHRRRQSGAALFRPLDDARPRTGARRHRGHRHPGEPRLHEKRMRGHACAFRPPKVAQRAEDHHVQRRRAAS